MRTLPNDKSGCFDSVVLKQVAPPANVFKPFCNKVGRTKEAGPQSVTSRLTVAKENTLYLSTVPDHLQN